MPLPRALVMAVSPLKARDGSVLPPIKFPYPVPANAAVINGASRMGRQRRVKLASSVFGTAEKGAAVTLTPPLMLPFVAAALKRPPATKRTRRGGLLSSPLPPRMENGAK